MSQFIRSAVLVAAVVLAAPPVMADPAPAAAAPSAAQGAATVSPQDFMVGVSERLFTALDSNRAAIRKNPEAVYPLVDQILLPQFDVEYAAQLVLAQNWRSATPQQRERFIRALYTALLHTYGGALADATADRLKILPFRGDPLADQVTVRTQVTRSGGGVVPVDYRLRRTADGWKAFDVVIEGISYVRNYRTDIGAEIAAKGLDEVTHRIETQGLGGAGS